jgi:hypothetical protein
MKMRTSTARRQASEPKFRKSPLLAGTVSQAAYDAVEAFTVQNEVTKSAVMDDAIRYRFGLGPGPEGWRTPEPEEIARLRKSAAKLREAPNQSDPSSAMGEAEGDSLRASLQRARRISPELAAATEAVDAALKHVEQALTALNLGVSASILLDEDRRAGWEQWLTFGKDGSTWRLLWERGPDGGDAEDWSKTPLRDASDETRLRAVALLPALVDRLVAAAEERVSNFKNAAVRADAVAAAISEVK